MGDNMYRFLDSKGLLHVDAQVMIDKDFKPEIKKLDYVSSMFIQQSIESVMVKDTIATIKVIKDKNNTISLLEEGSYVQLLDQYNFFICKAKVMNVKDETFDIAI